MKTTKLFSLLTVLALIMFTPHLLADDGDGGDNGSGGGDQGQGDDCQGGQIDGSETLIASVDLLPTTNAPSGAGGFAKLMSENDDGVVRSSLSMTITGLDAGVYTISIVKKSDGSTVDLGQVQIGGCGDGEDEDDNDDEGDDDGGKCCSLGVQVSENDIQLPDGVDPMDVGQILVSDSSGNVLLIGDLVDAAGTSVIKFRAKLRVGPGTLTVQTTGRAQALSTARKARRIDRFTMIGYGVQPSTVFTVRVNGQDLGTVKSNRRGNVLVRKLPTNLLTVRSVQLIDPNGQTAARAKF